MTKLYTFTNTQSSTRFDPGALRFLAILIVVMTAVCLMSGSAFAVDDDEDEFCSETATTLFRSCNLEARDDFFKAQAICLNVSDNKDRAQCYVDATAEHSEGLQLCRAQLTGRSAVCRALGEDRYDPDFNPVFFDKNFTHLTRPNPYFPLTIGYRWDYRSGTETVTRKVLNRTKHIEGVTCLVVNDRVSDDGDLIEDTDDWYAHAKDGTVWYCGEEVKDFETFDGDNPSKPELVSIDGSFKVGRDGDKPGILFPSSPTRGMVFRQEFSLNNAEDVIEILSTSYKFGRDPVLDQLVPKQLAERFCASGNCVVTKDYTPLEPGVFERKYYARGIGRFLETNPGKGKVSQLVSCNFDSRCPAAPINK
jgi:hypothetical protein